MSLRRLDILRMPGFERQGYDLDDLSPGLNLIHGPNASGKTTACRAIRGLLWPETLDGARPVYLRGEWNLQDGAMDMELIDGRRNCRRHGAPSEPPELPPAHEAGCFTITADDLGGASDDDQRLAGQIARQLAGGYDLPAVRKSDWLSLGKRTGYSERDALQAARDQVNEIRRRQQALRSEQQRLGQLQADAQAAADAQVSLQYLQAALERAARAGELRDVEARLAEFPDAMDALTGGEPERLNERRAELDQARQDLQQAETQIAQAEAELAATTFAGREPTREELSEQKTHLNQWRELSRQVDALTEKLTDAQGRLEEASEAVGGVAVEDLAELDTDALDGLDQFHQELVTQRQRVSAVEAELAGLGEAETPSDAQGADANTLLAGAGFLRRILR
ncbi:MAG: AAA family ATPase, partial [Phycisphaerae bacterium]|nr:AAA family ATPase [Phycisphaerae bacterium]